MKKVTMVRVKAYEYAPQDSDFDNLYMNPLAIVSMRIDVKEKCIYVFDNRGCWRFKNDNKTIKMLAKYFNFVDPAKKKTTKKKAKRTIKKAPKRGTLSKAKVKKAVRGAIAKRRKKTKK